MSRIRTCTYWFVAQRSSTMTISIHDSTDHYAELHFNVFFILLTTTNPRLSIIYLLTRHLIHSLGACVIRRALLCCQGHQPCLTVTGVQAWALTLNSQCLHYYNFWVMIKRSVPGLGKNLVFTEKTKKPGFFSKNWKNREKTSCFLGFLGFNWFFDGFYWFFGGLMDIMT